MRKLNFVKKTLNLLGKRELIWSILGIFIVVQVFFAIEMGNLGSKLVSLEVREEELSRQNSELSGEIVKSTSLSTIENLSEKLGFIKPQNIIYIDSESTVAKAQ